MKYKLKNKEKLLSIAKSQSPRPSWKTRLGKLLSNYTTSKNCGGFDPEFNKQIRELRPDWFTFASRNRAVENKKTLLDMAKNGEQKPRNKTKLRSVFDAYTKKYTCAYDSDFDKEIRKIRPDWFNYVNPSIEKKKTLLDMAKRKEKIPPYGSVLEQALRRYTNKNSNTYCFDFDKKIRSIRPDWFKEKNDSNKKKKQLILKANKNINRPFRTSKLGMALVRYTCKSSVCYDENFHNTIKNIAPSWFEK